VAGTPGSILTFYSYKGGSGRTMALANVGWLLAAAGHRVCVIDWDLEAPGLHRYFHPFLLDPEMSSTDGIIDYVWEVAARALTPADGETADPVDVLDYTVRVPWDEFDGDGRLDLVPAGRQGPAYPARVNAFDWTNFYERLGGGKELEVARERLRDHYDYVLIDSRTGVGDTSGICTLQLPDRLVICYTLNRQSVDGAARIAEAVNRQRPEIGIFPVEMRVETDEKEKLETTRRAARQRFEDYVEHDPAYWNDAEVLYWPYYAFEEILAAFGDDPAARSPSTMSDRMERLAGRLTGWDGIRTPRLDEATRLSIQDKWLLGSAEGVAFHFPPQPSLDLDGAVQMGYNSADYDQATVWYRWLRSRHLEAGRDGRPHRPDREQQEFFLRPATTKAEAVLGEAAATELDPCLQRADWALGAADELVNELAGLDDREFLCEGRLCTAAEARQITEELTGTIERDAGNGYFHHRRASRWWTPTARALMSLEALAILGVLVDLFNVAPRQPFITPAQTFTVLALSILSAVSQMWSCGRTGWQMNTHREVDPSSHRNAIAAVRSGGWWAAGNAVLALAITALLTLSLASLARVTGHGLGWQLVGGVFGALLGVGTPFAWTYAIALDGSSVSRRRDAFAAALEDQGLDRDDAEYAAWRALDDLTAAHDEYTSRYRPDVLRRAQSPVLAAESAMRLLYVMLGVASPATRRDPERPGDDSPADARGVADRHYLPPLRWGLQDAPEIDDAQLGARDRSFRQQVKRAGELRNELTGARRVRRDDGAGRRGSGSRGTSD
jgi:MinD-like ATPase involved in chromosome partitioning or flagellar assembly